MRNQTLTSLVATYPEAAPIFQAHGLDYCCRGEATLAEACARRGLDACAIAREVEAAVAADHHEDAGGVDARALGLAALVDYIREQHDMHLRAAIPFVAPLAARVAREHGARDPRLDEVRDLTIALRRLLEAHLDEEEDQLFATMRGGGAPGVEELGAIRHQHREIGAALDRLRALTDGHQAPAWACDCYRTLLEWLHALETNLMTEIHLENQILQRGSTCSIVEPPR